MYYGIVTQTDGTYTEYQLRSYSLPSDRAKDGAQIVSAKRLGASLRRRLRNPHVSFTFPGGVRTNISAAERDALLS